MGSFQPAVPNLSDRIAAIVLALRPALTDAAIPCGASLRNWQSGRFAHFQRIGGPIVWPFELVTVQVDCYGTTTDDADYVSQQVRRGLAWLPGHLAGAVRAVEFSGPIYRPDGEPGTETPRFILDWQLTFRVT